MPQPSSDHYSVLWLEMLAPSLNSFSGVFLGHIDSQEIMQSLRDLGVHISEQQAEKILKRFVHNLSVDVAEECLLLRVSGLVWSG